MSNIIQVPASTANYTVGRLGYGINGIIIHTVVGTLASADGAFQNPARQASAHYGVQYNGDLDGPIHQYVAESNIAWHCGRFYPDGSNPLANANTIGIEHADNGAYNSPRPDALYVQSSQLVKEICARYGIPIDRTHIRKHTEVSVLYTACPDSLDIDRIVAMAANGTYGPATGNITGDDDMLFVGPFQPLVGTVSAFVATSSYAAPSANAPVAAPISSGAAVSVIGYRYSNSAVQSSDRGAGAGAGPDYIWWKFANGNWTPDANLDTSALVGAPIGTAVSTLPATMQSYFVNIDQGSGPDDDSTLVSKTDLANAIAALPKPPTKGTGTVTVTLS